MQQAAIAAAGPLSLTPLLSLWVSPSGKAPIRGAPLEVIKKNIEEQSHPDQSPIRRFARQPRRKVLSLERLLIALIHYFSTSSRFGCALASSIRKLYSPGLSVPELRGDSLDFHEATL